MPAQQDEGPIGRMVGRMIRRSVRARFRAVYWRQADWRPGTEPPLIFAANHHGWHDGYLMYHLITRLGVRCLDWIAEFDAFPLFAKIGGMPFPPDRPEVRAATIRRTVRLMREEGRSLVLFPESDLHRAPDVRPFGKALAMVCRQVPGVRVVPVAIRYDMGMHERPEALLRLGSPIVPDTDIADIARAAVVNLLSEIEVDLQRDVMGYDVLVKGTDDVNERWDMRRIRKGRA